MDFSLDDLLNEVEGVMKENPPQISGGGLQTSVATDWSHPPLFRKPSDALEKERRSVRADFMPHTEETICTTPQKTASPPTAVATIPVFGVASSSTSCVPTDDVADIDSLLGLVTVVQEESGNAILGGDAGSEPQGHCAGFLTMAAQDSVPNTSAPDGVNGALMATAAKRRRCGTVHIAGTATQRGFCASSMSQCACDRLRCTDCNFEVLCFFGRVWDASTDYIFLRNNSPDAIKLSTKLKPSSDACAYACQCSWQTVQDLCVLSPAERPRWVCGGH